MWNFVLNRHIRLYYLTWQLILNLCMLKSKDIPIRSSPSFCMLCNLSTGCKLQPLLATSLNLYCDTTGYNIYLIYISFQLGRRFWTTHKHSLHHRSTVYTDNIFGHTKFWTTQKYWKYYKSLSLHNWWVKHSTGHQAC